MPDLGLKRLAEYLQLLIRMSVVCYFLYFTINNKKAKIFVRAVKNLFVVKLYPTHPTNALNLVTNRYQRYQRYQPPQPPQPYI